MTASTTLDQPQQKKHLKGSTVVMIALGLGVIMGGFFPSDTHPQIYETFRFCSRAFIALIKGLILPLVVATLVHGIAQAGDIKLAGRLGVKALVWFECVTTVALFIGLFVAQVMKPGLGLPLDLRGKSATVGTQPSGWDLALHLFPSNLAKHAVEADLLPMVVFSILLGVSIMNLAQKGNAAAPLLSFFESMSQTMFVYTGYVMKLTPIGVFGAMAASASHMASGQIVGGVHISGWSAVLYLIGRYAKLVGSLYLALFLLAIIVFFPALHFLKIPKARFFEAVRGPATTAFATASSEAGLPSLLTNLRAFGVPDKVASFVVPAGYSFNLDGSTLYLALASMSIAQAAGIPMSLSQQLMMMFAFMLTSKGVAGVPRATLVIIAATCGSFGLPGEAGVAMLLAIDELMDMGRSAVNLTGNALATVVIAKWEKLEPEGEILVAEAQAES